MADGGLGCDIMLALWRASTTQMEQPIANEHSQASHEFPSLYGSSVVCITYSSVGVHVSLAHCDTSFPAMGRSWSHACWSTSCTEWRNLSIASVVTSMPVTWSTDAYRQCGACLVVHVGIVVDWFALERHSLGTA
eukprot:6457821-Amphidinium_carterae.2